MTDKIFLASDHGGVILKDKVLNHLKDRNIEVLDLGPEVGTSVDYPDYAEKLCTSVRENKGSRGILICGTGIGMSISANKINGIRATLVWDEFTAKMSREHNDSNVLVMGERVLNHDRALDYTDIWLETKFGGDRHQRRLDKISTLEK